MSKRDHLKEWLKQLEREEQLAANQKAITDLVLVFGLLLAVLLIPVTAHLQRVFQQNGNIFYHD